MHIEDIPILGISLDRRPDRWAAFLKRSNAAHMRNVHRLSAVDAKTFEAHTHPSVSLLTAHNILNGVRRAHHEIDRPGAIGCSLSHFKAWSFLETSSAPAVIIFEDDAQIPLDFNERLKRVLHDLSTIPDWDMVSFNNTPYMDGSRGCAGRTDIDSPWSTCTGLMGAQAYMLSRRGAASLLRKAYPIEMHVDAYMAYMARMNHITMLWHRSMQIDQAFTDSDINHGSNSILNVPTNMEKHGLVALNITSIVGLAAMAAIAGGLVALAYRVRN